MFFGHFSIGYNSPTAKRNGRHGFHTASDDAIGHAASNARRGHGNALQSAGAVPVDGQTSHVGSEGATSNQTPELQSLLGFRHRVADNYIVYVGRITYRKGVDLLIEAIPRISKKYLNVHWIIGGDGDKFDNLKFLVKRLGLESRVELLGRIAPGH